MFQYEYEQRLQCLSCNEIEFSSKKDTQLLIDVAKNGFQVTGGNVPMLSSDEIVQLGTGTYSW